MRIPRVSIRQPLEGEKRMALIAGAAKHLLTCCVSSPVPRSCSSTAPASNTMPGWNRPEGGTKPGRLRRRTRPAVESPLHVTLVQGVSRGERMDYTVQKAVELGVAAIVPVLTERSVVKLDADRRRKTGGSIGRRWPSAPANNPAGCGCRKSARLKLDCPYLGSQRERGS